MPIRYLSGVNVDSNTLVVDAANDRVGIGTTSPSAKLEISGFSTGAGLKLNYGNSSGTIEAVNFIANGGANGVIGMQMVSAGVGDLWLGGSGGRTLTLYRDGNVGIGTTSPGYKLEVNGGATGNNIARFTTGGAGGGTRGMTIFSNDSQVKLQVTDNVGSVGSWAFLNLNPDGGNVGIGTTSPAAKLDVNGSIQAGSGSTFGIGVNGASIYMSSAAGLGLSGNLSGYSRNLIKTDGTSTIEIGDTGTSIISAINISAGDAAGVIALKTGGNNTRLHITSGGNVGIGTSSPVVNFQVNGASEVTQAFSVAGTRYLQFYTDGTIATINGLNSAPLVFSTSTGTSFAERMRITSAGSVGIGTTSPSALLHVSQASANTVVRIGNNTTYDQFIYFNGNNDWSLGMDYSNSNAFVLSNASSIGTNDRVVVTTGGNVGIGTTSPFNKLTVGSVPASGYGLITISSDWASGTAISTGIKIGAANDTGAAGVDIRSHSNYAATSGTEMSFWTNSTGNVLSERMRIDGTGNVGIGTTAPGNRLEVRSATSNSFFTSFTPSAGSGFISIYQDSNNHPSIYGANASGTATIVLNTSGVSYLTGGNVLIGATADAGFKLDVNGTGRFSGVVYSASRLMVGITSDQTYASIFIGGDITTGGNQYALLTDPQLSGTNNYGVFANARIKASHAATNAYGVFIVNNERISGATIANNYGLYIQNQTNGSTLNYAVYSEGGTSFFNGNVGIGTTSPGARLDVRTSSTNLSLRLGNANGTNWDFYSYNDSNLYINNAVGTLFTITNTGNVGIGTAAPSEKLEVSGAISATGAVAGLSAQGHSTTLAVVGGTSVLYAVDWGAEFKPLSIQGKTISLETGTGSTSARITIDNSGNVGIGTTAPGAKLDIVSTGAGSEGLRVDGASGGFAFVVKGGSDYTSHIRAGATIGVNYVTTPPSNGLIVEGNVGIGTTAPSEKLHVDGSTLVTYNNSFQSTNSVGNKAILARVSPTSGIVNYAEYATAANLNGFVIGSDDARVKGNIATDSLELITNTSTRMTILSSGNVGINTTTPGSTLHVIGDVLIQTGSLGVGVNPNATDGRIDASNDIVAFSTSDRRLKENITPITNALEKVRSLTGVEFDWKEETKSVHGYEGHDVGVIAQDVQAVLPEAVRTNDSGYLSVRYEKMIALLVEAMKEQQAQIDELKAQINDSPR